MDLSLLLELVQRSVHLATDLGERDVPQFLHGSVILCDSSNKLTVIYLLISTDADLFARQSFAEGCTKYRFGRREPRSCAGVYGSPQPCRSGVSNGPVRCKYGSKTSRIQLKCDGTR